MENLTHSLIGASLAEVFVPRFASPAKRGFFFAVGVLAANLPDADLLYTRITQPAPLGYLLHHRGHTHTIAGLIALGALFSLLLLFGRVRRGLADADSRKRIAGLLVCALASHIIADAWNSYGVHPFWPVDNHWYYGDAIFIYEPWLWVLLGVPVAMNTRTPIARYALLTLLIAVPLAMTGVGMLSPAILLALAVAGVALASMTWSLTAKRRAGIALGLATAFVLSMLGLNRVAHQRLNVSLAGTARGELVDEILNPQPGNPLCWTAILIERNSANDRYALRRGTISVMRNGCSRDWEWEWSPADSQSIPQLRALATSNCQVNAWLRFGRAPYVRRGRISDYRFGDMGRSNFSSMTIVDTVMACPSNVPPWEMPREDLLTGSTLGDSALARAVPGL